MYKLYVFAGAVLLASAGLFFRALPVPVPGPIVGGMRGIFGVPCLFLIFFILHRLKLIPAMPAWPRRLSLPVVLGGLCLAANASLFMTAMNYTTTGNVFALSNATPVYNILITLALLGLKPTSRKWQLALITVVGLTMTWWESIALQGLGWGVPLALAAGFAFAGFFFAQQQLPPAERFGVALIGNALAPVLTLLLIVIGQVDVPLDYTADQWLKSIGWIAALALIQYAIPISLFTAFGKKAGDDFMTVIPSIAAVLSPFWPAIFGLESYPSMLEWAGAITVHIGVVLTARSK